ncbi:MAG: NAD(P)/FAD-dependent oxidoreductase [Desulfurococcales archaeon]|nr:NAD(P)/FAD-dependent oxidoreductase [Desulfurococcales archaeon]
MSRQPRRYDVVVVGGGVGGYPAAIKLARHGYKVALIEEKFLGGECTNYGCVPSKAFYRIAHAVESLEKIACRVTGITGKKLGEWAESIVLKIRNGLSYLLEKYGINYYNDHAVLKDPNGRIRLASGEEIFGKYTILAPGTDPRPLPGIGFDGESIISNREVFYLEELPSSILIVGAGVIGVEIAYALSSLGVDVYLVEALPRVLPVMDPDISRAMDKFLRSKGVRIYKGTTLQAVEKRNKELEAKLSTGETINVEKILVAIGRVPKSREAGVELAGVDTDRKGFILVDESYRTSNPRIYAAGDAIGPPLLAHKAMVESVLIADAIMGKKITKLEPASIPTTIFSGLEIATIGYSEEELKSKGIKYKRIRMPLASLSAVAVKDGDLGFVKILVDKEAKNKIYGIQIVSPNASEVISSFIPIYLGRIQLEEAAYYPYPHLTVSEAVREFAEYLLGEPVHFFIKK